MTFRQSLARYVQGLLVEIPTQPDPPTPSPSSIPPTTTPSTTTNSHATSEAGLVAVVLQTMREMQSENLREIRGMVMDILQGRPMSDEQIEALKDTGPAQPLRTPFDPPDYDSADTSDLPMGLQAVFEREQDEKDEVRRLRTEQEVLARQRDQARAALLDPQGSDFVPSSLTD